MKSAEQVRINVIGQAWSGKTTLVQHMADKYGFAVFRPSDVIREYANTHNLPLRSRKDYAEYHEAIIMQNPFAFVNPVTTESNSRLAIDGMRVFGHVEILKKAVGMQTLALDCPSDVRYERFLKGSTARTGRELGQITTLDEFLADEVVDNTSEDPAKTNVVRIMNMADLIIDATVDQEIVNAQADVFIETLLNR